MSGIGEVLDRLQQKDRELVRLGRRCGRHAYWRRRHKAEREEVRKAYKEAKRRMDRALWELSGVEPDVEAARALLAGEADPGTARGE